MNFMNLIERRPRLRQPRVLASGIAAVAIGASVAIGGSALSAAASQATPAATPQCTSANLRVWLGVPGDGAAGHVAYQLEFSNVSNHTCTLFGYPGVSAVASGGGQLGTAAARDTSDAVHLVTLPRGATAHAFLITTNVGFFPPAACKPTTAIGLKVFPPNATGSQVVGYSIGACAKKGPVFLRVRAVVAGTGIPGYST